MAGCERCALKRRIGERGKKEKRKGKRGKNGDQNRFFFVVFFIIPRAGFFICAVVIFQIYKENCI